MAPRTVMIGYGDTGRAADVLFIGEAPSELVDPALRRLRPDDRLPVLRTSTVDD